MSTTFEILVTIMKIILTKKVSYCSHYFSFGQHYFCNLTDRQAFFIMEASTDQKNFHVIMAKKLILVDFDVTLSAPRPDPVSTRDS